MSVVKVGLSIADFARGLAELPECLRRFEALGVDSAELLMGDYDVVVGARVRPAAVAELKRIVADSPLSITVHGPIASSFTDRRHLALQMDVCRAMLDVSGEIGATVLVHHAGAAPHGDAAERAALLAIELEALAEIAPHAQSVGVPLCVENIFGDQTRWFASPSELAAQIRAVDHPYVQATIDFSHAFINAGQRGFDPIASLAELAPVAGHLHVHDSFGRPETFSPYGRSDAIAFGLGDLHLPPGWGVIDWAACAALPYSRDVVANLELSARFTDALPDAIALCRDMARASSS